MATFNYFSGIREDLSNMIGELGNTTTVSVPTKVIDAFGNLVSKTYTTYTEIIWIRPLNEILDVQGVGQLNKEDVRFEARYDTHLVVEATFTYNGNTYIVISIDKPEFTDYTTHKIGYAKRVLS